MPKKPSQTYLKFSPTHPPPQPIRPGHGREEGKGEGVKRKEERTDTDARHVKGNRMIQKAKLKDAKEIQRLLKLYSNRGEILPRSLSEVYDHLRDFFVSFRNRNVVGVCALHICWDDLAEIRSLAVQEEDRKRGIGHKLVQSCLEEAKMLGVKRVFALSYRPEFFEKLGFKRVDKTVLPHKIWSDCMKCVKFPDCDEIALLKELD